MDNPEDYDPDNWSVGEPHVGPVIEPPREIMLVARQTATWRTGFLLAGFSATEALELTKIVLEWSLWKDDDDA